MEFNKPYFAIFSVLAALMWTINYFHLFKRPQISAFVKKTSSGIFFKTTRMFVWIMGFTGFLFIAYSMMEPRIPQKLSENEIEVKDIMMVMDLSRSMLAIDMEPNRFEVAKQKVKEFVKFRTQDRIGIVLFSERVFTMLPLTTDLQLVDTMIDEMKIGPLGAGTNIGDALAVATGRLSSSTAKSKIIILLTDGVSNVGTMTPSQAAEESKKLGIKIYCIGIGTVGKDAKLPVGQGLFGMQYQTIPGGDMDMENLKQIAKMTGGKEYLATDKKSMERVFREIDQLEKTKVKTSGTVLYDEKYYSYLLYGVLLLFAAEFFRRFILREAI